MSHQKFNSRDDELLPDGVEVVFDDLALEDLHELAAVGLLREGEVGVGLADDVLLVKVVGAELDLDCLLLIGGLLSDHVQLRTALKVTRHKIVVRRDTTESWVLVTQAIDRA